MARKGVVYGLYCFNNRFGRYRLCDLGRYQSRMALDALSRWGVLSLVIISISFSALHFEKNVHNQSRRVRMSKLYNYNKGETLATGFVRPKVTALFFDKIWVPDSLLQTTYDYLIPKQVLVREKRELRIRTGSSREAGLYYCTAIVHNNWEAIPAGEFFKHQRQKNTGTPLPYVEGLLDNNNFKYSHNRNHAIMISAEKFCRQYRTHISPIYHDLTEFEREIAQLDHEDLYRTGTIRTRLKKPDTFLNRDALAICVQEIPIAVEEELSWEHVLDIRSDEKSFKQLKRFTAWTDKTLDGKTPNQIQELLASELEKYREILRQHGVKTAIGSFSTIVSSASSIASILSGATRPLLPILSIMAVSIGFTVNTYFENLNNRNNPIAYLYNVEERRI